MTRNWDRLITIAGLLALSAGAWAYLFWMARAMYGDMPNCPMHDMPANWTSGYFWMTFVMWAVMMVAMMLPSALPMVLTFATVQRRRGRTAFAPSVGLFVAGYLVVWSAFSLLATSLQWLLNVGSMIGRSNLAVTPVVGGALLAGAGVYQWSSLKRSCLSRCHSPLGFLMTSWREGSSGAFVMGLRHGLDCTGCCAAMMLLLFVAGVMNLLWIALIGGLVLLEKLMPRKAAVGHAFGILFLLAGIVVTAEAFLRG